MSALSSPSVDVATESRNKFDPCVQKFIVSVPQKLSHFSGSFLSNRKKKFGKNGFGTGNDTGGPESGGVQRSDSEIDAGNEAKNRGGRRGRAAGIAEYAERLERCQQHGSVVRPIGRHQHLANTVVVENAVGALCRGKCLVADAVLVESAVGPIERRVNTVSNANFIETGHTDGRELDQRNSGGNNIDRHTKIATRHTESGGEYKRTWMASDKATVDAQRSIFIRGQQNRLQSSRRI